jgi:antitoxin (DNA-binding transcriptional repressor) of toxin-antitoxin stability system
MACPTDNALEEDTMRTITMEAAQSHLGDIIDKLTPGEEVVITLDNRPVARLVGTQQRTSWPCKAGSAKDTIHWIAPDFDAPLDEFEEYM